MNKKKIIFLSIIILIVIFILVILFLNNNKGEDDLSNVVIYDPQVPEVLEIMEKTSGKITTLNSRGTLYTVKTCLSKFFMQCALLNDDDGVSDIIYSMLNNKYIEDMGITIENIKDKFSGYEDSTVEIYNIYKLTYYDNVSTYFVEGVLRSNISNNAKEFKVAINLDKNNETFEIYMDDYIADVNIPELKEGDTLEFEIPESVENRIYNIYSPVAPDVSEISSDYLLIVRNLLLYDIDRAYSMLDESAKENYNSIDDLKNFVNEHQSQLRFLFYGANDINVDENGREIYTIYDSGDRFVIDVYFDSYSTFTFNIYLL